MPTHRTGARFKDQKDRLLAYLSELVYSSTLKETIKENLNGHSVYEFDRVINFTEDTRILLDLSKEQARFHGHFIYIDNSANQHSLGIKLNILASVLHNNDEVFIIFRGTVNDDTSNWFNINFKFFNIHSRWLPEGKIHQGFKRSAIEFLPHILNYVSSNTELRRILEASASGSSRKLNWAGHSLGGAIALDCVMSILSTTREEVPFTTPTPGIFSKSPLSDIIRDDIKAIIPFLARNTYRVATFGCPGGGNLAYSEYMSRLLVINEITCNRYIMDGDPVVILNLFAHHVGTPVLLDGEYFYLNSKNHSMGGYIQAFSESRGVFYKFNPLDMSGEGASKALAIRRTNSPRTPYDPRATASAIETTMPAAARPGRFEEEDELIAKLCQSMYEFHVTDECKRQASRNLTLPPGDRKNHFFFTSEFGFSRENRRSFIADFIYVSKKGDDHAKGANINFLVGIFHDHEKVIVVFRGGAEKGNRHTFMQLRNVSSRWSPEGKLHHGFKTAVSAFWPLVLQYFRLYPLDGRKLYWGGHSMGSCFALMTLQRLISCAYDDRMNFDKRGGIIAQREPIRTNTFNPEIPRDNELVKDLVDHTVRLMGTATPATGDAAYARYVASQLRRSELPKHIPHVTYVLDDDPIVTTYSCFGTIVPGERRTAKRGVFDRGDLKNHSMSVYMTQFMPSYAKIIDPKVHAEGKVTGAADVEQTPHETARIFAPGPSSPTESPDQTLAHNLAAGINIHPVLEETLPSPS